MKIKIYLFFAFLSVCLTECTVESRKGDNPSPLGRVETLTARIDVSTKTAYNNSGVFSWSANEDISIHRSESGYEVAPLTIDGCFNVHLSGTEVRNGFALYPARIANDSFWGESDLSVSLPSSFDIPSLGMENEAPLPMIAFNDPEEEDLAFRHIGGVVRLSLNGVPYETASLTVSLGKRLTGDFSVEDPLSLSPRIETDDQAAASPVFNLSVPLSEAKDDYILNVPVPTGTYEHLTVEARDFCGNLLAAGADDVSLVVNRAEGIKASLSLSFDVNQIPLAIKAIQTGKITVANPFHLTIEHSLDNASWTASSEASIILPVERGKTLFLRGNNASYATGHTNGTVTRVSVLTSYTNIQCDHPCYVYGNIMSMVDGSGFAASGGAFTGNYALAGLFMDNTFIIPHPSLPLVLPATTLKDHCYDQLFKGCTNWDATPELPAMALAPYCYNGMFSGCSLTTAPELPATEMKESCYAEMLARCKSITIPPTLNAMTLDFACYRSMFSNSGILEAPTLPATVMADYCYNSIFNSTKITTPPTIGAESLAVACFESMFYSCKSLESAPNLPFVELKQECYESMFAYCTKLTEPPVMASTSTMTIPRYAYRSMFNSCTSLSSAPELNATTINQSCYENMFYGCTSLVTGPSVLPATTLQIACYKSMFENCTSLTTAPDLPAESLAADCYQTMFKGCSSLSSIKALFTVPPQDIYMINWLDGVSSNGTFYKNPAATWDDPASGFAPGASTVPSGWTITPSL